MRRCDTLFSTKSIDHRNRQIRFQAIRSSIETYLRSPSHSYPNTTRQLLSYIDGLDIPPELRQQCARLVDQHRPTEDDRDPLCSIDTSEWECLDHLRYDIIQLLEQYYL